MTILGMHGQIELMGKTLDAIEALTALNDPDADAKAKHLSMVVIPGIMKSMRDKMTGPGRDPFITFMETEVTNRLKAIGKANGLAVDLKPIAEKDIETDRSKWTL